MYDLLRRFRKGDATTKNRRQLRQWKQFTRQLIEERRNDRRLSYQRMIRDRDGIQVGHHDDGHPTFLDLLTIAVIYPALIVALVWTTGLIGVLIVIFILLPVWVGSVLKTMDR